MLTIPAEVDSLLKEAAIDPEKALFETSEGTVVMRHWACEALADYLEIVFDEPKVLHATDVSAVLTVSAKRHLENLDDPPPAWDLAPASAWATGEAYWAPPGNKDPRANTSFSFVWAVAEKRAKDRVVMKLSGLSRHLIYSEEEADVFRDSASKRMTSAAMKRGAGLKIWKMYVEDIRSAPDAQSARKAYEEWAETMTYWPRAVVEAATDILDQQIESFSQARMVL